jgi:hypothetical protein
MNERYYNNARIFREIREAVLVERGFLYTAWRIAVQPGATLQQILTGDRDRFLDPVKFLFVCVALVAVVMNLDIARQIYTGGLSGPSGIPEPGLRSVEEQLAAILSDEQTNREVRFRTRKALQELQTGIPERAMQQSFQWVNVTLLLAVPFYALGTWLVFNRKLCLAEHLVINGYLYGLQCLLSLVTFPIYFFSMSVGTIGYFVVSTAYQFFAWHQVFKISGWREWIGCVALLIAVTFTYLVVTVFLMMVFFLATILIDW